MSKRMAGVSIAVAGFGKHPAWDDHADDVGTLGASLLRVKKLLYEDGIRGCIDAGAWGTPGEAAPAWLMDYGHVFVWRTGAGEYVCGRLWPSRDGRGRDRYPFVVAAQCNGLGLGEVVRRVMPRLAALQERVVASTTREAVREVVARAQEELSALASGPRRDAGEDVSPGAAARFARSGAIGDSGTGRARVLFEVQQEMGAFLAGERVKARGDAGASHVRAPGLGDGGAGGASGDDVPGLLLGWGAVLSTRLVESVAWLVLVPETGACVDVVVGEASADQFMCIRAGPGRMPMASEVPYELPTGFEASVEAMLTAWASGAASPTVSAGAGAAASGEPSAEALAGPIGAGATSAAGAAVVAGAAGAAGVGGVGVSPARVRSFEDAPEPTGGLAAAGAGTGRMMLYIVGACAALVILAVVVWGVLSQRGSGGSGTASGPGASGPGAAGGSSGAGVATQPTQPTQPAPPTNVDTTLGTKTDRVPDKAPGTSASPTTPEPATTQPTANPIAVPAVPPVTPPQALSGSVRELAEGTKFDTAVLASAWREEAAGVAGLATDVATTRLTRTRTGLMSIQEALPAPALGELPGAFDGAALRKLASERQDAALREGVRLLGVHEAGTSAFGERLGEIATTFGRWSGELVKSVSAARELQAGLDAGRSWGAPVAGEGAGGAGGAGGASFKDTWAALSKSSVFTSIEASLGAMPARCRELVAMHNSSDVPTLVTNAQRSATAKRASEVGTALARLHALGWPASEADLVAAGALREQVKGVADAQAIATLERDGGERWAKLVDAAATPEDLDRLAGVGGPWRGAAKLSPASVLNLEVRALRAAVRPGLPDAQVRELSAKLGERLGASSAVAGAPALAVGLRSAVATEQAAPFDPAAEGPGLAGWLGSFATGEAVAGSVQYVWPKEGEPKARMVFVPVRVGATQRYVARDELSVGAFGVGVRALGAPASLGELMPPDAGTSTWEGPRTWRVEMSGDGVSWKSFAPATRRPGDPMRGWLGSDATYMLRLAMYAPGVNVEGPTETSPMQWLSPEAAANVAGALGCRVASLSEWRGAKAIEDAAPGAAPVWNLRDPTWRKQWEHLEKLVAENPDRAGLRADLRWPNGGAFRPEPLRDRGAVREGTPDDGVLWFVGVDGARGRVFRNIVGNVAEYVLSDDAPAKASFGAGELVAGGRVSVIGGSALGVGEIVVDEPARVTASLASANGFSDVGVRLAFSPKDARDTRPLSVRVVEVIDRQGLLGRASGGEPVGKRP
jgi:hypothetical protein